MLRSALALLMTLLLGATVARAFLTSSLRSAASSASPSSRARLERTLSSNSAAEAAATAALRDAARALGRDAPSSEGCDALRVWAVSDVHCDYGANLAWVEASCVRVTRVRSECLAIHSTDRVAEGRTTRRKYRLSSTVA